MTPADKAYIAELAELAASPELQALAATWPPPSPAELALVARVFGGHLAPVVEPAQPEHEEAA